MLTNALNTAVSGLNVAQRSLALVSQNVANANNPDYSRKVAQQESVSLGGNAGGVRISEVRRIIDQFLIDEVRTATSNAERYEVQNGFLDQSNLPSLTALLQHLAHFGIQRDGKEDSHIRLEFLLADESRGKNDNINYNFNMNVKYMGKLAS